MRNQLLLIALWVMMFTVLQIALSVRAGAAPLNWEGTAWIELYEEDGPTIAFTGGGVATVNGSGGVGGHLDTIQVAQRRGFISGSHLTIVTDPNVAGAGVAAFDFQDVQGLTGTGFGSFTTPSKQTLPGAVPVGGYVKVCLLSTACTIYLPIPLTVPTTLNGVPGGGVVGLGVGGLITAGGYGGIRLSIQHAPWTIKTVTATNHVVTENGHGAVSTFTRRGHAHGPLSSTSSTATVSGEVQLVAPTLVVTNLPRLPTSWNNSLGSAGDLLTAVSLLKIRFIPEPGIWLLLAAGVVGLFILGRLRTKEMRRW